MKQDERQKIIEMLKEQERELGVNSEEEKETSIDFLGITITPNMAQDKKQQLIENIKELGRGVSEDIARKLGITNLEPSEDERLSDEDIAHAVDFLEILTQFGSLFEDDNSREKE